MRVASACSRRTANAQVRQGKLIVRNETEFRDYRKFEAESQIKFQ